MIILQARIPANRVSFMADAAPLPAPTFNLRLALELLGVLAPQMQQADRVS